ncbi:hypothetical protein OOK31_08815 [Streptomyces sp. NBC_00249]|uniref:hypothetical protein n=1 Tax=Streptomyces sp. NBC_00249 TaxID=2975690 RepID=UPI00224C8841|nr:hypothetical protein [Streptomyces sp. NBC_00249]MCX5193998.1 hypothetical protein [Streptomyces sp. NBC_00249]
MNLIRIRRLVLKIVTAVEGEGAAVSQPFSGPAGPTAAVPVRGASDRGDTDRVFDGRLPWATEMAAPSFLILSPRLPR